MSGRLRRHAPAWIVLDEAWRFEVLPARGGWRLPFRRSASIDIESLRRLYLASALLELGRPQQARAVLDEIGSAALPDPYDDWREWARLHTSPEVNDAGRADSVVRVLAGRPDPGVVGLAVLRHRDDFPLAVDRTIGRSCDAGEHEQDGEDSGEAHEVTP